jgi:hypothetical protein
MNDSFLSIVETENQDILMVRARRKEDLTNVFPKAPLFHTPERDYPFRTFLDRYEVEEAIADRIAGINYSNFKDSVHDPDRKRTYMSIWSTLLNGLQTVASLYRKASK